MRVNPVCYNIPRVTAMSKPELTEAQNERIIAFGQRNQIRRLTWLYQPIRTGPDAGAAAMLIEFNPADVPSLSALAAMEEEIGGILDCKIDLHLYLREMYLGYGPGEHGIVYDRADHMRHSDCPSEKIAEFCKRKKDPVVGQVSQTEPERPLLNMPTLDSLAGFGSRCQTGMGHIGWSGRVECNSRMRSWLGPQIFRSDPSGPRDNLQ